MFGVDNISSPVKAKYYFYDVSCLFLLREHQSFARSVASIRGRHEDTVALGMVEAEETQVRYHARDTCSRAEPRHVLLRTIKLLLHF